jgi:cyclopropane fatty-acyl-phospholipid synthase-like methyltransferase
LEIAGLTVCQSDVRLFLVLIGCFVSSSTGAPAFDPDRYQATRDPWDTPSQAWHEWGPTLQRWLGSATELMLDMAGVKAGIRVLDVAGGAGDQTLNPAKRLGPAGSVLATDLSPKILEFADRNARSLGSGFQLRSE